MRKFIESLNVSDYEVYTEDGWKDITHSHLTIPYSVYLIRLENGMELKCADTHILIDDLGNEVFAAESLGVKIQTTEGPSKVVYVKDLKYEESMYDLTVNSQTHTYYTNDILSHNTTTAVVLILWYVLFNPDKTVAVLGNKWDTSQEILERFRMAYQALPEWLQHGIVEWNKRSVVLENQSKVFGAASSSDSIRGKSVNFLYIDECAHVENWTDFYTSSYPTLSSGKDTKLLFTSTPNGLNHFYKFWMDSQKDRSDPQYNGFNGIKVSWQRVPGRDEEWRKHTLGALNGDLQKFAQEYEAEFLGSSGTLISGAKLKELVPMNPIHDDFQGLVQYEEPIKGHNYFIVSDVSRGKGLDYSAFHVIDVTEIPYKQVCVFHDNMILTADYAAVLNRVGMLYNNAYVLVESNDIGAQVPELLHTDYEYENVLYTENKGARGKQLSFSGDFGVRTTTTVKAIGCSMLKQLVEQDQLLVKNMDTIGELSTFSKKGKSYEAEPGCHDDLVMGLVLFAWATSQPLFKDLMDHDIMKKLRERTAEQIDENIMAFGFIDDGQPGPDLSDQLFGF